MQKREFLDILEFKLRSLPESQRQKEVEFYDKVISQLEDTDIIERLGSPGEVAEKILAKQTPETIESDYSYDYSEDDRPFYKKISPFWWVVIGIFAVIIVLPVLSGVFGVIMGIFGALFGIVAGLFGATVGFGIAGIAAFIASPFILASGGIAEAALAVGAGFALIGLAMLFATLLKLSIKFIIWLFKLIFRAVKGLFRKRPSYA